MEQPDWTPVPFDLLRGSPFAYSSRSISAISATEAFNTGINERDKEQCVICGTRLATALEHAHLVAKVEHKTWEQMRELGFIPLQARSVEHETRNGVLMCKNHHSAFDGYFFFVRWVPEFKRFIFINHSRDPALEEYHGRAINLHPNSSRLPFHGSFLIHEMRVRGRWPFLADRPISLPINWQVWIPPNNDDDDPTDDGDINDNPDGADGGSNGDDDQGDDGDINDNPDGADGGSNDAATRDTLPSAMLRSPPMFTPNSVSDHNDDNSFSVNTATRQQPQTFTPTNPFANPAELQAMKRSFAQQPNWKATVVEGETWEGNAEENIAKWRGLVGSL